MPDSSVTPPPARSFVERRRRRPVDRLRVLTRRHGPTARVWRGRAAILSGAIMVGLAALLFAWLADQANEVFLTFARHWAWSPLIVTPLAFAGLTWVTRRHAPDARGSGIPQIIAARLDPAGSMRSLVSARTALAKFVMTLIGMLVGASVGREGPTVQISAAIMAGSHRLFRMPVKASVMVAGGAAGVAAAFNTPLAGVTFAIEELAAAYEQRMTLLVMTAVLISGIVSLGIAGDYVYFGVMGQTLPIARAIPVTLAAGIGGGLAGGMFSKLMLAFARSDWQPFSLLRRHPLALALGAGIIVALLGYCTQMTWGTGYHPAKQIILGNHAPWWFGPSKFLATLATAVSGVPGGIFAPSLATGAGLGDMLRWLFPAYGAGPVVLLGMIGYFTGVVRAPLTAVVIISEATGSHGLLLPLVATALIADATSSLVCPNRLYHSLSRGFTSVPQGTAAS